MHEDAFVLKNEKGKRIQATLRVAYGDLKGTMIILHGLGGWKDQYLLVVIAEAVRSQGYHVLTFDAADGAKGPDAEFAESTSTEYLHDLEEVVTHIQKEPWFTAPLVIAAHSQGGLVGLRYTALHQEMVSRLVLIAPLVSWKIGLPFTIPIGIAWLVSNNRKTPGPGPVQTMLPLRRKWLLDLFKYDGYRDAKKVQAPTLVLSATYDTAVGPPSVHESLVRKLADGTHITIPDTNHIFYRHEREVADTIVGWLSR